MAYEITITKISEEEFSKQGAWVITGQENITHDQYSNLPFDERKKFKQEGEWFTRDVYGYAPNYQAMRDVTTEVLKQRVESLYLSTVIKAINGL